MGDKKRAELTVLYILVDIHKEDDLISFFIIVYLTWFKVLNRYIESSAQLKRALTSIWLKQRGIAGGPWRCLAQTRAPAKIIHPEYCQQSYVTVIQASSEKAMFDERTAVIAGTGVSTMMTEWCREKRRSCSWESLRRHGPGEARILFVNTTNLTGLTENSLTLI